jgi:hypothetical protein
MSASANPEVAATAFAAFERLYVLQNPVLAENQWRSAQDFEALPEELRTPDRWYRFERAGGIIRVDENLNGQYFRDIPKSLDPSRIVEVPASFLGPSLLDKMRALALAPPTAIARSSLAQLLERLAKMTDAGRPAQVVREIGLAGFAAALAGSEAVHAYLGRLVGQPLAVVMEGYRTGREMGALLLIERVAKAIAAPHAKSGYSPDPRLVQRLLRILFSPGALSLEHLAARFLRDGVQYGLTEPALRALDDLRREGDAAIQSAREGFFIAGHPSSMLFLYYNGLFAAGAYLNGAYLGYEVLAGNPKLEAAPRDKRLRASNAVEEKLVRIGNAMLYAIADLDNSRLELKRAQIQLLIAQGEAAKAQDRIMEAIDLNLFYPRPFRSVLSGQRQT